MKVSNVILVSELASSTSLAGAAAGTEWFQKARIRLESGPPGWHAVDFHDVQIATVSWLREAVVELQRFAAVVRPDIDLVAVNLSALVREELAITLEATKRVMIASDRFARDVVHQATVLGRLDNALRETLNAIQHLPESDAPILTKVLPGGLQLSAANNRLALLETKGILRSEKRGRKRIYRAVMENLQYGN